MSLLNGLIGNSMMSMFQSLGINRYEGQAKAELTLTPLGYRGNPIELYGVGELRLQYNPETLDLPEISVDYVEHYAIAMTRPVLHYTGTKIDTFPVDFVITDDVEGPPHATRDSNGNMVYNEFHDLYAVYAWLRALTQATKEAERPPMLRVDWGPWSEIGVVKKLAASVVAMYPSGYPKIMEINMDVRPEPVYTDSDKGYYEVK